MSQISVFTAPCSMCRAGGLFHPYPPILWVSRSVPPAFGAPVIGDAVCFCGLLSQPAEWRRVWCAGFGAPGVHVMCIHSEWPLLACAVCVSGTTTSPGVRGRLCALLTHFTRAKFWALSSNLSCNKVHAIVARAGITGSRSKKEEERVYLLAVCMMACYVLLPPTSLLLSLLHYLSLLYVHPSTPAHSCAMLCCAGHLCVPAVLTSIDDGA